MSSAPDPFLVLSFCIIIVALLVANFYILVYWQSPEDKNESYFAKALVVIGLTVAEASVLLLPLDVENNSGDPGCSDGLSNNCGNLDFVLFWEVFFCTVCFCVIVIVPFAIFYYEADDGLGIRQQSRFLAALKTEIVVIIVSLMTLLCMFFFLGYTDIPVKQYSTSLSSGELKTIPSDFTPSLLTSFDTLFPVTSTDTTGKSTKTVTLQVTFSVYVITLTGWVGWFLFSMFGGIGLAALPIDLIAAFIWRPRHMDAVEFAEHQLDIQRRSAELIEVADLLRKDRIAAASTPMSWREKRAQAAKDRAALNKLTQMVFVLEKDHEELKLCQKAKSEYSPLVPYAKLLAGFFALLISILWWLHIILYMLVKPPTSLFLNFYFEWFNSWFPIFGTLSYTIFAFYMLLAAINGCFKVGLRFFLFKIHPMEPGKTLMNSFLFNLGLIQLCSIPCVQFCAQAFKAYARNASVNNLFGVQVTNMRWFKYWYNNDVFVWIILLFCALTALYLSLRPRDSAASATELKNKVLQRRRA